MSWLRRLLNLLRSNRHSRDLDRELRFHLAERTDELVAAGMHRGLAELEARRRFGNYAGQKERARDVDIVVWLASLGCDLRYALRSMRHNPALTVVAILSLGLGIGANAAIFTLIDAVMLRGLPVSHPEQLLEVTRGESGPIFTNPIWEQLRDHQTVFSSVFTFGNAAYDLSSAGEVRQAVGTLVSGDFFHGLGLVPAAGRLLSTADDYRGCPDVAVLSYGFWQSQFGGDPRAVGRSLKLSGHPFTVVGVAPPSFTGLTVGLSTQIFAPICTDPVVHGGGGYLDGRSTWWLRVIGRPKPGLGEAQVLAGLSSIAPGVYEATVPPNWRADMQQNYRRSAFGVQPAARGISNLRDQYKTALFALMVIAALVLIIACANVANLLLARAATRQREMAVRVAIGAGRGRIIRQLLTESLALSVAGSLLGLLLARWGAHALVAFLSPAGTPIFLDLSIDNRVLAFGVAVALLTGLTFGLAPAWRAARVQPSGALKANARGAVMGGGRGPLSTSKMLVVAQIAVSLTLLVGAGLLLATFRALATQDLGFRPQRILVATIDQKGDRSPDALHALQRQTLARLRAIPGMEAASLSALTPLGGVQWNEDMIVPGYTAKSEEDDLSWFNEVSDGYFGTMGTPIVAGRDFNGADRPTSQRVAIVNEAMALKFFKTREVLGRTFRMQEGNRQSPELRIVGLAKDAKYQSLRETPQPTVYLAMSQDSAPSTNVRVVARASGSATSLEAAIKAALGEVEPRTTESFVVFTTQIADSMKQETLLAMLSAGFGGLALFLAMLGLYGVMSYNVARRRSEIGIRMALGAGQHRVARMVMGEVSVMVIIGLLVGTGLALGTTRLLSSFLYGLRATDPRVLAAAMAVLAAVAFVAAYLPALRAAHIDPMDSLREE